MTMLSRRTLLQGALLSGASLVTFDQLFGYSRVSAQPDAGEDPQTILNLALTSEVFACTHYYTVLTESEVALTPDEVNTLAGFLDAELYHVDFLTNNGAQALATEFYIPFGIYNDRQQFSEVTEFIETTFVAAYLAATRRLAELGLPLLAATAAQIVGIEQEHLALIRQIGGKRANNLSFSRPLFYNVSEAATSLQPFLEGGETYRGPVAYPGADAIRDLVRDVGVIPVSTFTTPEAFASADALEASASCTVTPAGNYNANLRSGPGLAYAVVDRLAPGANFVVNAQAPDNDGYTWYRSPDNLWIRADIVRFTETCGTLPTVSA